MICKVLYNSLKINIKEMAGVWRVGRSDTLFFTVMFVVCLRLMVQFSVL